MTGRTCKVGSGHGTRMRCLDVEKFEFWVSSGGFGLHFGRLLVTLGSLFQVFFRYRKEVGISTDTVRPRIGF